MARLSEPVEEPDEEDSAPRFRLRGRNGAAAGSGKRSGAARAARSKGASSDNEDVADEEVTAAWLADLEQRSPADLRNAFTLKPCSTKELRQLGDPCYLGGKRCAGALPIYDLQGKVSLQFLLASYKASEKSRDRLRGEDSALDLHRPFLRWLMKKARELQLLNSREVRRGALAPGRVEQAQKSGQWLMTLEQNQAEASDEEGRQRKAQQRQKAAEEASMKFDVQFPQPKGAVAQGESPSGDATTVLKERLRSQLQSKKDKIERMSSHGMDLHNMRDQLMAPSLSFDWNEPESDEDENSMGILQVEMPAAASNPEGRRALLREQLQRSVSFKQAKELSKVRSLPSSASTEAKASKEVRNAATPSKKRKAAVALSEATTEPELPEPELSKDAIMTEATGEATDGGDGPVSEEIAPEADGNEGRPAQRAAETVPEAEIPSLEAPEPAEPAEPTEPAEPAAVESGGATDEVAPVVPAPHAPVPDAVQQADVEISPTLRFEPEEPPAGAALEISPTLPFDIDATALQEACALDESRAGEAQPSGPAGVETTRSGEGQPSGAGKDTKEDDTAQEASSDEASEEDEEIKGDARAMRERAWLRHKRNMQAMISSQEDESLLADYAPRQALGRAPKRRAKASILMGR